MRVTQHAWLQTIMEALTLNEPTMRFIITPQQKNCYIAEKIGGIKH